MARVGVLLRRWYNYLPALFYAVIRPRKYKRYNFQSSGATNR